MSFRLFATAADRRLLQEGWLAGPMPWVIAIMMFLTALAASAGLGLGAAVRTVGDSLAGKLTVQIVDANPDIRESQARLVEQVLARQPGVREVVRISDEEMTALLEPWLGEASGLDADLPIPILIDAELPGATDAHINRVEQAVHAVAPAARVERHVRWLAPVMGLIGSLQLLAGTLVALMAAATASIVVLSARASLNTHRETIDVLHLMGATDLQITRLFQRRITIDAFIGGLLGLLAAVAVIALIGGRIQAMESEMMGAVALSWVDRAAILTLPLAVALLATVSARITVMKSLRKML